MVSCRSYKLGIESTVCGNKDVAEAHPPKVSVGSVSSANPTCGSELQTAVDTSTGGAAILPNPTVDAASSAITPDAHMIHSIGSASEMPPSSEVEVPSSLPELRKLCLYALLLKI